jgi:hypothetical protein
MHAVDRPTQHGVPRSTKVTSVFGVLLVVAAVIATLWDKARPETTTPGTTGEVAYGGGTTDKLLQLAPSLALILVCIVIVTFAVLYKARPHQR